MSRHLLIRCDRDGCHEQTETRASDTAPTSIGVPAGWLTLVTEGLPDLHYCSLMCMLQAHIPQAGTGMASTVRGVTNNNMVDVLEKILWSGVDVPVALPAPPPASSPYTTPAPVAPEPLKSAPRSRKSAKS